MKDLFGESWAIFNSLRNHRICLYRKWNDGPAAMVIGLNPSTANESDDDQTIGFVKRILNHNGYGSLYMVNLFTFVSPYPEDLKNPARCAYDKKQVQKVWHEYRHLVKDVVFAWGGFETFDRDKLAIKAFGDRALCVGTNKDGSPKHFMYIKAETNLIPFNSRTES